MNRPSTLKARAVLARILYWVAWKLCPMVIVVPVSSEKVLEDCAALRQAIELARECDRRARIARMN